MLQDQQEAELSANIDLVENFRAFCKTKGIDLSVADFEYIPTIGIVANSPGILKHLIQGIPSERDQLLSFERLKEIYTARPYQAGYLRGEKYMAMAHPHFRRSFSKNNNFAPRFVELFWEFQCQGINTYIALDEDRVRINVDDLSYLELDTWYGAPFSESDYLGRRDSDFNCNLKNTAQIKSRSKKLFKFNGPLKTETWVDFCCHFLTGNPLIFEYFTGRYPVHVDEAISRVQARLAQRRDT